MKAAAKILGLVAVCVSLVLGMGAPASGALLSGLVLAGLMLHGARCEHGSRSLEPSSFHEGARRPAHWYCADCGRTWAAPLDARIEAVEPGAPSP